MEKLIALLSFIVFFNIPSASSIHLAYELEGAWEMNMPEGAGQGMRTVMTIEGPYVFVTSFDVEQKKFYGSQGGMIEVKANKVYYTVEFNTMFDDLGTVYDITTKIDGDELTTSFQVNGQTETASYKRIDNGQSDLAGSWRITDRMRDGEMQAMRLGSRKTIKMITGTRFQWAAFDPESKRFSGTGGGIVSLENGKYTEHIEFFSRNPDRVGANLTFDYAVKGDKWTHSGKSSSGNPIKEIWTRQ